MKRPPVTLENCDTVYDFYERYDANMRRAKFAHAVIGRVFRPKVSYLDSRTEGLVRIAVENADATILACKHVNMNDPLHLVALTTAESVFEDFAGSTVIPSKRPLFERRIRRLIDDLGAIPTYRKKDYVREDGTLGENSSVELSHATSRLVDTCAGLMRRGKNLAIFPEAERSARVKGSDPSHVNPLKDGVARMYLKAIDSVSIAVVPIGLCYDGAGSSRVGRKPVMVIGRPLPARYTDTKTFMDDLAAEMQAAQQVAFELHSSGKS